MKKNPTINDIAKLANVSKATVSFVLNNKKGVSDETRQKVLSVMEQMDYKPSINSKRFYHQKSFTVAVVFDKETLAFGNLFYSDIINSLLKRCMHYDYSLIYSEYSLVGDTLSLPESILNKDIDGLIFLKDIPQILISKLNALNIPFVVADDHSDHKSLHTVKADYCLAAYSAVRYLIQQGHKHIGFVGNRNILSFYLQSFFGYQKALKEENLPIEPAWCYENISDRQTTEEYISELLKVEKLPTAIFCMEDLLAIELIRYLQKNGLNVPDDISVISVDDIIISDMIYPSLTTVAIDKRKIGSCAIDMLMNLINQRETNSIIINSNSIVIRESVKTII